MHTLEEIKKLLDESERIRSYTHAPTTLSDYAFDWRVFCEWCSEEQRDPLPASQETVILYLTATLTGGKKISTVRRRSAAISYYHRLAGFPPPADLQARALLSGARRLRCEQPVQKQPIALEQLRAMCSLTWQSSDRASVRDHSILTLGYCSALRRSNLMALVYEDVRFVDRGVILHVRREKNDQECEGRYIGIAHGVHPETCAVASLRRWIALRGNDPGPLYTPMRGLPRHMHPELVARVVKAAARSIGLEPGEHSGHSLRSGFISEAVDRGASTLVVARQTGHRSLDSLRGYYRSADLFSANPTATM
jgi:integrase